jgi:protein SCO1/2
MSIRVCVVVACCWLSAAVCAAATMTADDLARSAGFDQHLNQTVPLDLVFRDDGNQEVRLADYFGSMPVVLVFSYYGCSTLCPTVISNLVDVLGRSGLTSGRHYQVVVASIDPGDSPALAAQKKAVYLKQEASHDAGRGWHLLTGSAASITALTQAAGFHYAYDVTTHQYAHPAGVLLLTPQGRIARYFFGFDFTPAELGQALNEASAQRIASPVERLVLLCFHFDPSTGKYSATILQTLRWMAVAMLLAAAALVAIRRRRKHGEEHSPRME